MRRLMAVVTACVRKTVMVLLLLVGAALPAFAQGVGAIGGTVTDTTGSVLPGASVTLTSLEGTVGSNQETVTDPRGAFQFLRLVPGTYRVRAELSGFRPAELPRIIVDTDATSRADLRLDVGTLQEGVTVTGAAPLLDTKTAFKQTVIGRQELEALPNRTDVWSMARIVPGIVMGNIDVGGSERFFQGIPAARGSTSENKTLIDGMDISSMNARGTTAMMYPDPFAFEQASIQLGAPSAEYSAGGVTYNMITRSGTNQFHGGGTFNATTPALAKSQNYSPELYAQLLSSIPAKVRAANPDLQPNADIRRMVDAGAWLGGPIVRDKVWFAGTWRDQRQDQYTIGNYNADGTQVLDNNAIWTTSAKVSWQIDRNAQLSYFNNLQYKLQGHRSPGAGFFDNLASTYNYKYPTVNQAKFTTVIRSNMALDVTYNRLRADDYFNPQPGVTGGAIATTDSTTQISAVAQPSYNVNMHHRDSIRASLSWVKSTHDMKVGIEAQHNSVATPVWSTSGMRANFANGSPVSVNTYVVAVSQEADGTSGGIAAAYTYVENIQSAFAQDKWSPHRKLTLNFGVRYERQRSYQPETCYPQNQFFTSTRCFDTVTAPSFNNFAPRFNLVYDVNGDGRTALKFTANRYLQPIASSIVSRLNPLAGGTNAGQATVVSDTRQWLPQARCGQAGVTGCDRNGDLIPQVSELGPAPGYVFLGVNAFYSPDVKREVSNEYTVEFQRQLPMDIVLSAVYAHKETRNNVGNLNTAAPPSSWIGPITVTEVQSGKTVQVWNRGTSASAFLNYNSSDLDLNYNGLDITLNKRMGNRFSLSGGASFGRARVTTRGGNRNDPNITESAFDAGLPNSDAPWSYRLSGVYLLPYDISFSGTGQYQVGAPETTTVLVTNQTISLAQGTQSVVVAPIGDIRLPNIVEIDLNLRRAFKVGGGRRTISPRFEVFNATNNATINGWISQLGPTYHTPSSIQRGRLIKMEVSFDF
jgi:hypothetical protein